MTFIDALNNPETRSLIERIEEIEAYDDHLRCNELACIRTNLIKELKGLGYERD